MYTPLCTESVSRLSFPQIVLLHLRCTKRFTCRTKWLTSSPRRASRRYTRTRASAPQAFPPLAGRASGRDGEVPSKADACSAHDRRHLSGFENLISRGIRPPSGVRGGSPPRCSGSGARACPSSGRKAANSTRCRSHRRGRPITLPAPVRHCHGPPAQRFSGPAFVCEWQRPGRRVRSRRPGAWPRARVSASESRSTLLVEGCPGRHGDMP